MLTTINVLTGETTYDTSYVAPVYVTEEQALETWRAHAKVSRFQARAALLQAGLLDDAEAAVAGAGVLAQLAWADAIEFRRNSPTIAALAGAVGLNATQLDDLFRAAAEIEA